VHLEAHDIEKSGWGDFSMLLQACAEAALHRGTPPRSCKDFGIFKISKIKRREIDTVQYSQLSLPIYHMNKPYHPTPSSMLRSSRKVCVYMYSTKTPSAIHRESPRFLSRKNEYARVIPRDIYNFAFGVSSAKASAYILSSSALNFFAVWGRLSFNLFIASVSLL
jgi:hypothetical protein